MAKLPLIPEEQALPYAKYYDLPVVGEPPEDKPFLDNPLRPEQVLSVYNAKDFILPEGGYLGNDIGYALLPDGTNYSACAVKLPGVYPHMMKWMFQWMDTGSPKIPEGCGNLRYKIWCPPDHWDQGALDKSRPGEGAFINESLDLGQGASRIYIHTRMTALSAIGIDAEDEKRIFDSGCAVTLGLGYTKEDVPTGIGINFFREIPGGCEWISRGWGGYTVVDGKIEKIEGYQAPSLADMRTELLHNLVERRHLPKFLPQLYAEQGNKPLDED